MNRIYKSIIACFCAFAMSISMIQPAKAISPAAIYTFLEWSSTVGGALLFWKSVSDTAGDLIETSSGQRPSDWLEQLTTAEQDRNAEINSAFGSGGSRFMRDGDGTSGVRIYYKPTSITANTYTTSEFESSPVGVIPITGHAQPNGRGYASVSFTYDEILAPFNCRTNSGLDLLAGGCVLYTSARSFPTGTYSAPGRDTARGNPILWTITNQPYPGLSIRSDSTTIGCTFTFSAWVDCFPLEGSFGDMFPTINITDNSRVGSLVGDYYFENSNGNWVAESIQVVNEGDNIFYNPYTDQSTNFDSFTYDYAEREYNLYADDGSHIGKVVYGDEYVTIEEGGNTYNFYYYIGSGGSDEPPEETHDFYEWWKNAWTSFTDRLFAVLHPSGGSGADDDTITENTPPQTDADGNEWSLGDLTKAALQGVWKIGSGIVKVTVGGVTYLIETITDAGDFFAPYNDSSGETGIYSMFNEDGGGV